MPLVLMPAPLQDWPTPLTSSTVPLQSSSEPLHTSFALATPPEHFCAPITHWYTPTAQRVPAPEFSQSVTFPVGQHGWLTHGSVSLSSLMPSQSLSTPSQI